MKIFLLIMITSLLVGSIAMAGESREPYEKYESMIDNERINIEITNDYHNGEIMDEDYSSVAAESIIKIKCKSMCGGEYKENIDGCAAGIFQFTPGAEDVITTWVPRCLQPFRVIIYNISPNGIKKVLDANSGAPPQFVLGKTIHCDVITFFGTQGDSLRGTGKFKRWVWAEDKYILKEDQGAPQ